MYDYQTTGRLFSLNGRLQIMGDLTKNFNREEFACKGEKCCGHSAPVHLGLAHGLQILRDLLDRPIIITSGFRCRFHNKKIGGSLHSYHCIAMAADIIVPGFTPDEIANWAEKIGVFRNGGIGIYSDWVHLDVRSNGPARWTK